MARPASSDDKVRLHVELPARLRERLAELRALTEADSVTEVVRRALAVYDVLVTRRERGFLRSADGTEREVLITGAQRPRGGSTRRRSSPLENRIALRPAWV
jgi:hypothetical protein